MALHLCYVPMLSPLFIHNGRLAPSKCKQLASIKIPCQRTFIVLIKLWNKHIWRCVKQENTNILSINLLIVVQIFNSIKKNIISRIKYRGTSLSRKPPNLENMFCCHYFKHQDLNYSKSKAYINQPSLHSLNRPKNQFDHYILNIANQKILAFLFIFIAKKKLLLVDHREKRKYSL